MAKTKKINDIVVLDTSVILYDADCIFKFDKYNVVIPLTVLDEVDKFRSLEDETGRNARKFIRSVNELRKNGDLNKGVYLNDDKTSYLSVKFAADFSCLAEYTLDMGKNDDKILAVCLDLLRSGQKYSKVSLVTKDISMTVKAHVLGITILDYSDDKPINDSSELYSGIIEIPVDSFTIDAMYTKGTLSVEECMANSSCFPDRIYENEGVILKSESNKNHTALAIFKGGKFHKLKYLNKKVNNVSARNMEQSFALEFLMDPDIKLVTLTGAAGCGKTLLSVACGLHLTGGNENPYSRFVVSRPIQPMGRDLGFLPGSALEKIEPYMGPIRDAVEFAFNGDMYKFEQLLDMGVLDIEPLTYIRGRSLPNTLFVLDEAQNLTRHEMKTIISRIGKGSKIVLTGDVYQIDNPYLDTTNNGLTIVLEKFKDSDLSAHVHLVKGQRSRLATMAANIL